MPVICWKDEEHADHDQRAPHPRGPGPAAPLAAAALDSLHDLRGAPGVVLADVLHAERGHGLAHLVVLAVPEQPPG
jgi:hypothetical protein